MSQGMIDRLLAGALVDPDYGGPLDVPTCRIVIAGSLAGREADLVAEAGLAGHIAVVSDPTTRAVLGARVEAALATAKSVVLGVAPHADMTTVTTLRAATRDADAIVAVGSGTVNDLCKYTCALDGKPYAAFATAPSMDGYTSINAAITEDGHKKSLPAQAPAGVFMDLEILAAAPARMIRAGLGDAICRPTANADWLLSHLLFDGPYREAPFHLLDDEEDALFAAPEALMSGDPDAMARLARTLILSGFGMTICGGSYPASQGEHLISHYCEMMAGPALPLPLHGEQIAVTTLTMVRLQQLMLERPPPQVRPGGPGEDDFTARFGADTGASCWTQFNEKRLTVERAETLNARLSRDWEAIRRRIKAATRPVDFLQDVLRRAGAPTRHGDLGWTEAFYRDAVRHARELRDRYTFLDLAADSGMFETESVPL
jgi:glycerol-1-phosphate dehydrogenase [NAD(P)+]